MSELSLFLHGEADTVAFGQKVGAAFTQSGHEQGGVVFLCGTLGAGKTTFTRGVLKHFGHSAAVKSPTYTLVEPYDFEGRNVYHFDLYRLADPEELEYMGIREYFDEGSLCIVEWPDQGNGFLPQPDIIVELTPEGESRRANARAGTARGESILALLAA